jgi:hypothetical protein
MTRRSPQRWIARDGDPNNRQLGVVWSAWPSTLVFDASDSRSKISVE